MNFLSIIHTLHMHIIQFIPCQNADIHTIALGFLCSQQGEVDNLLDHPQMSGLGENQSHKTKISHFLFISLFTESLVTLSETEGCMLHTAK